MKILVNGVNTILVVAKLDELIVASGEISYIINDEVDDAEILESDFDIGFLLCNLSIQSLINHPGILQGQY
jgi:hypothetical protein